MGRKILISFLGNNKYKKCVYKNRALGFESPVVQFVQEAVVQMHCKKWTKNDQIFIFLTDEAKLNQWEGDAYGSTKEGLETRLKALGLKAKITPVEGIPKGFTEEEMWQLFDFFYEKIEENDEVYFDITHGFRSLPMLGMVLINYAKVLKKIDVKSITYGAFEAIGFGYNIEERIPNPKNRIAPLLELISFSELQDWTIAADSFSRSGDSSGIIRLTEEKVAPILKTTKGASPPARTLNSLSKNLELLSGNLATNRGHSIVAGKFIQNINTNLKKIQSNDTIIPALRPILHKINQKLQSFNSNLPNWIAAVGWCIQHNLTQQGITQLQEGLLSHFCKMQNNGFINLDPSEEKHRDLIRQAILIFQKKIPQNKWYKPASENIEIVNILMKNDKIRQLAKHYVSLSKIRNDINHGGYLSKKTPDKFKSELITKFELIQKILEIN